jgi:DNA polymerase/3'-5' exonuclease PolX
MNYAEALHIAEKLKADLAPYCERIEIAGSVRRKKPENIKDIEIVCIPKSEPNLFGESLPIVLYDGLLSLVFNWDAEIVKNGPKYKQFALPMTKLDLFITTPECWGVIFAIRTGPADYSKWLVTSQSYGGALPFGYCVKDGRVSYDGVLLQATPEEDDFFRLLGIASTPEPWERTR